MKLEHLLHEALTETTLVQLIVLSDSCSFSMLHPQGIDYNTSSAITSIFLFFANKEYYLKITIHSKYDIAFFQVCNFVIDLNKL